MTANTIVRQDTGSDLIRRYPAGDIAGVSLNVVAYYMLIILEGERPVTLNKYYAGMHWSQRNEEADRVHMAVLASTMALKATLFQKPVDITVRAYFKDRPQDSDNIMAKMYIDGLKGRVITDDNRKYVRAVTTVSLVDKQHPRVEIEIIESVYGTI